MNNAGIIRWAGLPDADLDNLERHLAVHVAGSFNTIRAAWPHFVEQGYGRIVNTTSAGVFGLPANLGYATAKGGVIGMTRSLATAGAAHGIKVNLIAPAAMTRMAGPAPSRRPRRPTRWRPTLVAPMVAYLAHEDCPVTGEIYAAGAGRFARIFLASTRATCTPTGAPTVEDVAAHWAAINDEAGYTVPGRPDGLVGRVPGPPGPTAPTHLSRSTGHVCSRSSRLRTLPEGFRGRASMKHDVLGHLELGQLAAAVLDELVGRGRRRRARARRRRPGPRPTARRGGRRRRPRPPTSCS